MEARSISIDGLVELQSAWAMAPQICVEELEAATVEADALLERETKELTPIGASGGAGGLRDSITSDMSIEGENVIGQVGTAMAYAIPVELGTKPHWPPIEPLIEWVAAKFGLSTAPLPTKNNLGMPQSAFSKWRGGVERDSEASKVARSIAMAIAVRGTPAVGMFHLGFAWNEDQVVQIYTRAADRIYARLATMGA
jgi:hypothetical protein